MMRGQAFDTFKLMIAAVVAVAILGILPGILGGIATPGQSFDDTAKQLITKATQSPGAVYPSAGEVTFQKDSIYPSSIFKTVSGGRNTEFSCANTALCEQDGSGENAKLKINYNLRAQIYVCCPSSTSDSCQIGIGDSDISCS